MAGPVEDHRGGEGTKHRALAVRDGPSKPPRARRLGAFARWWRRYYCRLSNTPLMASRCGPLPFFLTMPGGSPGLGPVMTTWAPYMPCDWTSEKRAAAVCKARRTQPGDT